MSIDTLSLCIFLAPAVVLEVVFIMLIVQHLKWKL